MSSSTRGFVLLVMAILGPGFTFLLWNRWEQLREEPWFILLAMGAASVFGWVFMARYAVLNPQIVLESASGDLVFRKASWGRETMRIGRDEVEGFEMSQEGYTSGKIRVQNHVLWIRARGDRRIPLCVSPDEELVRKYRDDLAGGLGMTVEAT